MDDLNKELRQQAIILGLCTKWQKMWDKDFTQKELIDLYYSGLDFCLIHHWPSNDFILKHFNKDTLRTSNVFVNDKYSVVNPKESVILGQSETIIRYNSTASGIIHIRDNSSAKLIAKNRSFVIVHLYESAYLEAEQCAMAKIVVVKHSPNVTIVGGADIKIREEYDFFSRKSV